MQIIANWLLKKGSEKKFRFKHPWVFSNELAQSPKGVEAGTLVDLRDYQGQFLARGYGHPNSLISFRTLTTANGELIDRDFFHRRLAYAARLRRMAGVWHFSHRLCFAEGDLIPGLIIDRYRLLGDTSEQITGQVFVVQSSTAGMDRLLNDVVGGLELLVEDERKLDSTQPTWEQTAVVFANDSKSRIMENIAVEPKRVFKGAPGFVPDAAKLLIQPGDPSLKGLRFNADLIGGQKTGFFLDQRLNVQLIVPMVRQLLREKREIRVLDLCCYIGQWGTQLAHLAHANGGRAIVTCVDASAKALEIAAKNVTEHVGQAEIVKMDVLEAMAKLPARAYDVVICDPPAFIKKKKDVPAGSQAYYKMNREAIRKVASSGVYVSCSCSGLFAEEEFREMLSKLGSVFEGDIRWLVRGGHSPDHPQRAEFPQGTYLKAWIGVVR